MLSLNSVGPNRIETAGGEAMPRKQLISRELGENYVTALAATEPAKIRGAIREWAAENKNELHDLLLDGLDWQQDT